MEIFAAAKPANNPPQSAGSKTFNNDLQDSITLTEAYLVVTNAEIQTGCDARFSASASQLFEWLIPSANAHTDTTPTATGIPYVIDLLSDDNQDISIGSLAPPTADYCGVQLNFAAADEDTIGLPNGLNLVGTSLHLVGTYTEQGGATGNIQIDTGITLLERNLLLNASIPLNSNTPSATIFVTISYDTWFDAIDMEGLETATQGITNPSDSNVNRLFQNIVSSIHQR